MTRNLRKAVKIYVAGFVAAKVISDPLALDALTADVSRKAFPYVEKLAYKYGISEQAAAARAIEIALAQVAS